MVPAKWQLRSRTSPDVAAYPKLSPSSHAQHRNDGKCQNTEICARAHTRTCVWTDSGMMVGMSLRGTLYTPVVRE